MHIKHNFKAEIISAPGDPMLRYQMVCSQCGKDEATVWGVSIVCYTIPWYRWIFRFIFG